MQNRGFALLTASRTGTCSLQALRAVDIKVQDMQELRDYQRQLSDSRHGFTIEDWRAMLILQTHSQMHKYDVVSSYYLTLMGPIDFPVAAFSLLSSSLIVMHVSHVTVLRLLF